MFCSNNWETNEIFIFRFMIISEFLFTIIYTQMIQYYLLVTFRLVTLRRLCGYDVNDETGYYHVWHWGSQARHRCVVHLASHNYRRWVALWVNPDKHHSHLLLKVWNGPGHRNVNAGAHLLQSERKKKIAVFSIKFLLNRCFFSFIFENFCKYFK